jgi:hypothetical protein
MRALASASDRNHEAFRHSARRRALNASMKALSVGFPDLEKSISTPFRASTSPPGEVHSYARNWFPPVVIQHAVWLYGRFALSSHDVEDLLAERGLDISYETIRRWVLKFGPAIAWRLRRGRFQARLSPYRLQLDVPSSAGGTLSA